jgi:Na+-driven multidrug efflux pump
LPLSWKHCDKDIAFAGSHVLIGVFEGRGTTRPILMSMVASFVLIEFPLLLWLNHILPLQPEPLWLSMIAAYIAGFSALGLYFWRQG